MRREVICEEEEEVVVVVVVVGRLFLLLVVDIFSFTSAGATTTTIGAAVCWLDTYLIFGGRLRVTIQPDSLVFASLLLVVVVAFTFALF
ncbi:hypothetical protein IWX49DRAFT_212818 [Phyllosticta citricarpa]|uniref:Transmembrane protein n=1 Tax=Phyllosticta citricarpa TaxID=55181 RepID=A0ABR1MM06_9PEZI